MISHLDKTLEELLRRKVPLPSASYDISFDIPTKDWASKLLKTKETINLYLYDIKENRELRTNEWQVNRKSDGTVDQEKPPVRIDLSYLITAWSPADVTPATEPAVDEHHLLSMILEALFKYPYIPSDVLHEDLAMIDPLPEIPATVAQSDGFKDQGQGQFWNAIDQFWKPSIQYVVTIPLDLHETTTGTIMVATKIVEYGFIVPVRILSIHPAIREDIPKGSPLMGVNVEATPAVRLDDSAGKDGDQITVNSVDELSVGDMLMIVDGKKTEFCHIKGISDTQISVSDKLVYDHEEGAEIKRLGRTVALGVKLVAVGLAKSSELQVSGGRIRTLRVGEVVMVDNPEKVEYFRITGISGHEIGLGSSETIIQLGGIVTNGATPPAPIIGAKVTLSDSNGMSVGETFTDSEGKFAFKSLVKGEYAINVSAHGYAETTEELGEITSVETGKLIIKLESI